MASEIAFRIERGARVHIHQAFTCCPYAGAVTSRIHDYVERNGHAVVDDPRDADVQIVNTCGSDAQKAQLTFDALERVRERAPESALVVAGCLVNIEPRRLREATRDVARHALLDPRRLRELDAIFDPADVAFERVPHSLRSRYAGNPLADGWYHVTAGTGCLGRCSFCAIRRATGRPNSRTIAAVLADVARGIEAGRPDVLLVGTDLSAWGHDLGLTCVDLLRALADLPDEALFAGESFEPTLFLEHLDEILPLLATRRFSMLALPIQSGSQRVLDSMRRTYRIDAVLRAIERIREADPGIVIRTDVIYGWGDETHAEFEATLDVLPAFDQVGFNVYQPRPGTPDLQLPAEDFDERHARVMDVHRARAASPQRTLRRIAPLPEGGEETLRAAQASPESSALVQIRSSRDAVAPAPARDDEEDARWARTLAPRLDRVIARRGGLDLGDGFRVGSPRIDDLLGAIVLDARGPSGEHVAVALCRPDRAGEYAARSDRFAAFVIERGDVVRTDGAARALRALFTALGLR